MSLLDAPPAPHHFTPEHVLLRTALRAWVAREITAQANAWDEAETFPRDLYKKAASIGLLGLGYPEHLGGTPAVCADAAVQIRGGMDLMRGTRSERVYREV